MKAFKLENEPKIATGFKTPENYFDDFSAKVLQQLNQEKEVKVIPLYKRKKLLSMIAAAVVFIALMIPVVNNYNNTSKDLDEDTLETYLSYQSNLNQYDLIRELDTKDIEKLNKNVALEQETLEDILASNPNLENLISE
jgi:plasmid maintenance system killer protein